MERIQVVDALNSGARTGSTAADHPSVDNAPIATPPGSSIEQAEAKAARTEPKDTLETGGTTGKSLEERYDALHQARITADFASRRTPAEQFATLSSEQRRTYALLRLGEESLPMLVAGATITQAEAQGELFAQLADPKTREAVRRDLVEATKYEVLTPTQSAAILAEAQGAGVAGLTPTVLLMRQAEGVPQDERLEVLDRALAARDGGDASLRLTSPDRVAGRVNESTDGVALRTLGELTDRIASDPSAGRVAAKLLAKVSRTESRGAAVLAARRALASREDALGLLAEYPHNWGAPERAALYRSLQSEPQKTLALVAGAFPYVPAGDTADGAASTRELLLAGLRTELQNPKTPAATLRNGLFAFARPPWEQRHVQSLLAEPPTAATLAAMSTALAKVGEPIRQRLAAATLAEVRATPESAKAVGETLIPLASTLDETQLEAVQSELAANRIDPKVAGAIFLKASQGQGAAALAAARLLDDIDLPVEIRRELNGYIAGFRSGGELSEGAADWARRAQLSRNELQTLKDLGIPGSDDELLSRIKTLAEKGYPFDDVVDELNQLRSLNVLGSSLRQTLVGDKDSQNPLPAMTPEHYLELLGRGTDTELRDRYRQILSGVEDKLDIELRATHAGFGDKRAAVQKAEFAMNAALEKLQEHAKSIDLIDWTFSQGVTEAEQENLLGAFYSAHSAHTLAQLDLGVAHMRANGLRVASQTLEFNRRLRRGADADGLAFHMWLETQVPGETSALKIVGSGRNARAVWNNKSLPTSKPPRMPQHVWDHLVREGKGFDLGAWQALHAADPTRFAVATPPELLKGGAPLAQAAPSAEVTLRDPGNSNLAEAQKRFAANLRFITGDMHDLHFLNEKPPMMRPHRGMFTNETRPPAAPEFDDRIDHALLLLSPLVRDAKDRFGRPASIPRYRADFGNTEAATAAVVAGLGDPGKRNAVMVQVLEAASLGILSDGAAATLLSKGATAIAGGSNEAEEGALSKSAEAPHFITSEVVASYAEAAKAQGAIAALASLRADLETRGRKTRGDPRAFDTAVTLAKNGETGDMAIAVTTIADDVRAQRAATMLGELQGHLRIIERLALDHHEATHYDDTAAEIKARAAAARALMDQPELRSDVQALRKQINELPENSSLRARLAGLDKALAGAEDMLDPDHALRPLLEELNSSDFVGEDFWGVGSTKGVVVGAQIAGAVAAIAAAAPSGGASLGAFASLFIAASAGATGAMLAGEAASELSYTLKEGAYNRSRLGHWMASLDPDASFEDKLASFGTLMGGYSEQWVTSFFAQAVVMGAGQLAARGASKYLEGAYRASPAKAKAAIEKLQKLMASKPAPAEVNAYLREVSKEMGQESAEAMAAAAAAEMLKGTDLGLLVPMLMATGFSLSNVSGLRAKAIENVGLSISKSDLDLVGLQRAYDEAGFTNVLTEVVDSQVVGLVRQSPTGQRVLFTRDDAVRLEIEEKLRTSGELGADTIAGLRRGQGARKLASLLDSLESSNTPFDEALPLLRERWHRDASHWNADLRNANTRLDPDRVPGFGSPVPSTYAELRARLDAASLGLEVGGQRDGYDAEARVEDGRPKIIVRDGGADIAKVLEEFAHIDEGFTEYRVDAPAYNLRHEVTGHLRALEATDEAEFRETIRDRDALRDYVAGIAAQYRGPGTTAQMRLVFDGADDAVIDAVTDEVIEAINRSGPELGSAPLTDTPRGFEPASAASKKAPSLFGPRAMKVLTYDGEIYVEQSGGDAASAAIQQINAKAAALYAAGDSEAAQALIDSFMQLKHMSGGFGTPQQITPDTLNDRNVNAFVRPLGLSQVVAPEGRVAPEDLKFGPGGAKLIHDQVAKGLTPEGYDAMIEFIRTEHSDPEKVVKVGLIEQAWESIKSEEFARRTAAEAAQFDRDVAADVEAGKGVPFEAEPHPTGGIDFSNVSPTVRAAFLRIAAAKNIEPDQQFFAEGGPPGTNLTHAQIFQRWFDAASTNDGQRIAALRAYLKNPTKPAKMPGFPAIIEPGAEQEAASAALRKVIREAETELRTRADPSLIPIRFNSGDGDVSFADERLLVRPGAKPEIRDRSTLAELAKKRRILDDEGTQIFNTWARTATNEQVFMVLVATQKASATFPVNAQRLLERIERVDGRLDTAQLRRDAFRPPPLEVQIEQVVAVATVKHAEFGAQLEAAVKELQAEPEIEPKHVEAFLARAKHLTETNLPNHLFRSDFVPFLAAGIRIDDGDVEIWRIGSEKKIYQQWRGDIVKAAAEHGSTYADQVSAAVARQEGASLADVAARVEIVNDLEGLTDTLRGHFLAGALESPIHVTSLKNVLDLAMRAEIHKSPSNQDILARLNALFSATDEGPLREAVSAYLRGKPVPRVNPTPGQDPLAIIIRESQAKAGDAPTHTATVLRGIVLAKARHLDPRVLETLSGSELAAAIDSAHLKSLTELGVDESTARAIVDRQIRVSDVVQTLGDPAAMANIERLTRAGRTDAVRDIMTDLQLLNSYRIPAALQHAALEAGRGQLPAPVDIEAFRESISKLHPTGGIDATDLAKRRDSLIEAAREGDYKSALHTQLQGLSPTALQESLARIEALNDAPGLNDNNRAAILERVLKSRLPAAELERVLAATPSLNVDVGQSGFDARVDAMLEVTDVDSYVAGMLEFNRLKGEGRVPVAGAAPSLDPLARYIEATQLQPVATSSTSPDLSAPHRIFTGLELVRQGIIRPGVFANASGQELQTAIRSAQVECFTEAGFSAERAGEIVDGFEFFSWTFNGGVSIAHLYGAPATIEGLARIQKEGYDNYVDAILSQDGADATFIPSNVQTALAMLEQDGELPGGDDGPNSIHAMLTAETQRRAASSPGQASPAFETVRTLAEGVSSTDSALTQEARSALGNYLTDWALQRYGSRADLEALSRIVLDFELLGRKLDLDNEEALLSAAVTLHRGGMTTERIAALPGAVLTYLGESHAALQRLNYHRDPESIARAASTGTTPAGQAVWNDLLALVEGEAGVEAALEIRQWLEEYLSPDVSRSALRDFRASLAATADGRTLILQHRRARFARSALPGFDAARVANPDWTVESAIEWYQNRWDDARTRWNVRVDRARETLNNASPAQAAAIRQQFGDDPSHLRLSDDAPAPGFATGHPSSLDELRANIRSRAGGVYTGSRDPHAPTLHATAGAADRATGGGHITLNPAAFDLGNTAVARALAHEGDHVLRGFNYRPAFGLDDVAHNALGETLAFLQTDNYNAPDGLGPLMDPAKPRALEEYIDEIVQRYQASGGAGLRYFGLEEFGQPRPLTDEERAKVVERVAAHVRTASATGDGTPEENLLAVLRDPESSGLLGLTPTAPGMGADRVARDWGSGARSDSNEAIVAAYRDGEVDREQAELLLLRRFGNKEPSRDALTELVADLQEAGVDARSLESLQDAAARLFGRGAEVRHLGGLLGQALRGETVQRPAGRSGATP